MSNTLNVIIFLAVIFGLTYGLSWLELRLKKGRPLIVVSLALLLVIIFGVSIWKATSPFASIFTCIIFFLPAALAYYLINKKFNDIQDEKVYELRKEENIMHNQLVDKQNKAKMTELVMKYGQPANTIKVDAYDVDSYIMLFDNSQILKLGDRFLHFKDIVDHDIETTTEISKGSSIINANLGGGYDGKSSFRRGFVNDYSISRGNVSGNISGTISGGTDVINEDLTIVIKTDNFSEPTIRYYVGNDKRLANDIVAILEIIERRNNKEK